MKLWSAKRLRLRDMGDVAPSSVSHTDDQTQFVLNEQIICTGRAGQSGFTLVESLAAFAMLAGVLTVVFAGITQTLKGDRRADLSRRALALAQSKLDQLGILEPLIPGERSGTLNGFTWMVVVRPTTSGNNSLPAFWVSASASAPQEFSANPLSVTLTTLKLGGRAHGQ